MPRKAKKLTEATESSAPAPVKWLRADYHFHVFHYRMPGTVAIAAVTPFVPSPLTVKMALVASLLQSGDERSAQALVPHLPKIEVLIIPPSSAFSFKAFLRYRSVPAVESAGGLDETGSYYPSRPHTREYALFSSKLTVLLGLPNTGIVETVKKALHSIRYIGCKDSLVTCLSVQEIPEDEVKKSCDSVVQQLQKGVSGAVILGADFDPSANLSDLKELIPGSRKENHYRCPPPVSVLPGRIISAGKTKIFKLEVKDEDISSSNWRSAY